MNFVLKIIDVIHDGKAIVAADYHITASDNENIVETQGKWQFTTPHDEIAFNEIEEKLILRWLEEDMQESLNAIKLNLENQLQALKSTKSGLPWVKPTFKPNIGI